MFRKKVAPEPTVTINNLSAYMHQRLDEAERASFRLAQDFAQAHRAALEDVARHIAPRFWDEAGKAGKTKMPAAELAAGIVAEVTDRLRAEEARGYARAQADNAGCEQRIRELEVEVMAWRTAQQHWDAAERQLRTDNLRLQQALARLQATPPAGCITSSLPAAHNEEL